MRTKETKPIRKVHLDNFHIAGFGYWEGCEAFRHLKIGTKLELVREPDNQFDPMPSQSTMRTTNSVTFRVGPTTTSPSTWIWGWRTSTRCVSPGLLPTSILSSRWKS